MGLCKPHHLPRGSHQREPDTTATIQYNIWEKIRLCVLFSFFKVHRIACTCMRMHACTHTHTHTDTHRHTQTHTDKHKHTQTHTNKQTHPTKQTQTNPTINYKAMVRVRVREVGGWGERNIQQSSLIPQADPTDVIASLIHGYHCYRDLPRHDLLAHTMGGTGRSRASGNLFITVIVVSFSLHATCTCKDG